MAQTYRMRALKALDCAGRRVRVGGTFDATMPESVILRAAGVADFAPAIVDESFEHSGQAVVDALAVVPKPKRTYKRRDLQAEE